MVNLSLRAENSLIMAATCVAALSAPVELYAGAKPALSANVPIGVWSVQTILDYAPISSLTDPEAHKLIGKILEISPDHIKFDDQECTNISWHVVKRNSVNFLGKYRIRKPDYYPSLINIATVSCGFGKNIGPFIILESSLDFIWRGVMLDAIHPSSR